MVAFGGSSDVTVDDAIPNVNVSTCPPIEPTGIADVVGMIGPIGILH